MISILANGPAEAEYYSARRGTVLFTNPTRSKRAIPTYDVNGRIYIHDKPSELLRPDDMWQNLLFRAKSTSTLNTVLNIAGVGTKHEELSSRKTSASSDVFLVMMDKQLGSLSTTSDSGVTDRVMVDRCNNEAVNAQRISMKRRSSIS